MSITSVQDNDRALLLGREIDDLLLQARGLVLVRDLLAERGAASNEVAAHTAELERTRRRLAATIRGRDVDGFGEAA